MWRGATQKGHHMIIRKIRFENKKKVRRGKKQSAGETKIPKRKTAIVRLCKYLKTKGA